VYVPHPVKNDISAAKLWGSLVFINKGYVYPDAIDDITDSIASEVFDNLAKAANSFTPSDYLLIAGDHLQIVQFSALLGARFPSFWALRYLPHVSAYMSVRIHTVSR
jgi:hypothetical protein